MDDSAPVQSADRARDAHGSSKEDRERPSRAQQGGQSLAGLAIGRRFDGGA
jgi:hypothetical protein